MSDWAIVEQQAGMGKGARLSHDVTKDRRTTSTGLDRLSAEVLVKRSFQTGDKVVLVEVDGYRTDITRQFEPRGFRRRARR